MDHPLHRAAQNGNADDVFRAFGAGARLREFDEFGALPLGIAAAAGNHSAVRALLDLGADPDWRDREGYSAWDYAVQQAQHSIVWKMLDALQGEAEARGLATALHAAATVGDIALVRELIHRRAPVNAVDRHGETALHRAVRPYPANVTFEQRLAVVGVLLEAGADPTGGFGLDADRSCCAARGPAHVRDAGRCRRNFRPADGGARR